MKKFCILLALAAIFSGGPALAQQSHIPKAQLEEMFANIRTQTSWDINGKMLWGYYFTSSSQDELGKISVQLVSEGYHFVEVRRLDSDIFQTTPEWQLHVERVELQTVDTLSARNTQFEDLASHYKNVVYDGMDVGPAT